MEVRAGMRLPTKEMREHPLFAWLPFNDQSSGSAPTPEGEPESGGRAAAGWAISSPAGSTRQTEKRSGRESSLGFRRLEAGGA